MIVYRILENGYFGGTEEYSDGGGIPYGTTKTEVPFISEGSYAFWAGNKWNIIDIAPVAYQAPVEPVPDLQAIPTQTNSDQLSFDLIFYEEPLIGEYEYNEA